MIGWEKRGVMRKQNGDFFGTHSLRISPRPGDLRTQNSTKAPATKQIQASRVAILVFSSKEQSVTMCAWHESKNFSPEYVAVLNNDDVRALAKIACTKANPPVVEYETNKAKTIICEYNVSWKCIHGDLCNYSHHPSRGRIDRESSQSIKDKWRTDYYWQLWALSYAGANSTEFCYANDAPHSQLHELLKQMHVVANRLLQKQRADADKLERQKIAQAKEANEQKILDNFREKTKLKEAIKKEMGDKLSELDSTLTVTLQGLRPEPPISILSFKSW